MSHRVMEEEHRIFFIVRNSGFLNMIEPYDEIMADRGFNNNNNNSVYFLAR